MRRPLRNLHGSSFRDKYPRNDFSAGLRNSSLEACGDWREIAERFVEDGDEIGRGIVYGGQGYGAVGGPGGTDFVGEEGEFGGVFEELLEEEKKEGVSFGFFFFFFSFWDV